jgi:hypothetical protein
VANVVLEVFHIVDLVALHRNDVGITEGATPPWDAASRCTDGHIDETESVAVCTLCAVKAQDRVVPFYCDVGRQ